ncbi:hypothetical protein SDC9_154319 [bioreactor metagenome]|uniref:Uncharacterized protein n=1 Tax=bioreactor metagenome TaxID=1076179 RepID=A0A645EZZ1_9ZZZZ
MIGQLLIAGAGAYAGQTCSGGDGVAEAKFRKVWSCLLGVFGASPDGVERVLFFIGIGEHRVEVVADDGTMAIEFGKQADVVGKAHGACNQRLVGRRVGQVVGLGVVKVLQAVFEAAQEVVGGTQCADRLG